MSTVVPESAARLHRDYTFLGTTESLCPECLVVVPAKIVNRNGRIYFRKRCPTHGEREDFVCSDSQYFDQLHYSLPAKLPRDVGVTASKGCPYDCGLCTEHEQHTCVALVEITSSCNLKCPMCFASSGPVGKHLPLDDCFRAIDRLVQVEGRPEVLQLSGGEPTMHPEFEKILDYAVRQPIDFITINTNGIRFAHDAAFVASVAAHRSRVEVYFQLDGLTDAVSHELRGELLTDVKLKAIDRIGEAGLNMTLAATLHGGCNDDQIGPLVEFARTRPWIVGISFQPATYSGRHVLPEQLDRRITFPDVIKAVASQTNGLIRESDFMPLPCAHPNCHSIAYCYRSSDTLVPLARFIDPFENRDLLANGITFTRSRAREAIAAWMNRKGLGKQACCGGNCGPSEDSCEAAQTANGPQLVSLVSDLTPPTAITRRESEFVTRGLEETLSARDIFRITITSFLDAYNFDLRRLMKCCTHHVLPSGHVIPFCAYNVLYREGHLPLPTLDRLSQIAK